MGYFKATAVGESEDIKVGGSLSVKLHKMPLSGKGSVKYEYGTQFENYICEGKFATIGTGGQKAMCTTAVDFGNAMEKWLTTPADGVSVISYTLTPLSVIPSLGSHSGADQIGNSMRTNLVKRMFDIKALLELLGTRMVIPYIKDKDEEHEFGRKRAECVELANKGMLQLKNAEESGNLENYMKALSDTALYSINKYRFSKVGTPMYELGRLVQKYRGDYEAELGAVKRSIIYSTNTTGSHHWIGWKKAAQKKWIRVSCWIKFNFPVPNPKENVGIKIHGVLNNDWLKYCELQKWQYIEATEKASGNDGNSVLLIFDKIGTTSINFTKLTMEELDSYWEKASKKTVAFTTEDVDQDIYVMSHKYSDGLLDTSVTKNGGTMRFSDDCPKSFRIV